MQQEKEVAACCFHKHNLSHGWGNAVSRLLQKSKAVKSTTRPRETHLPEVIHGQGYGNDRHEDDGKGILLVIFTEPQTDAEELKDVEWIENLLADRKTGRQEWHLDFTQSCSLACSRSWHCAISHPVRYAILLVILFDQQVPRTRECAEPRHLNLFISFP